MLLETESTPNDYFAFDNLGFKNYCFCYSSPISKEFEELLENLTDYPRESFDELEFTKLLPVNCLR